MPSPTPTPTPAPESVADLIAAAHRHGLRLTTEQGDFDRTGLDFLVVHAVDDRGVAWIVRAPRRRDVIDAARVEARVLRLARPRLPVAVPDWRVFADDLIAYPKLEGTPAVTIGPGGPSWNVIDPSAPSDTFLDSFARALAAMQSIASHEAEASGVPIRTSAAAREALAQAMDQTRSVLSPPEAVWSRWRRWLENGELWPEHVALVHGDLHPGHMLLAKDGRLVGILDWTEALVTDPSVDFAMFDGCFGREALAALIARFEQAGGKTWPRMAEHAAERWAAFSVVGAEWALRTGNETALEYARGQLAAIDAPG